MPTAIGVSRTWLSALALLLVAAESAQAQNQSPPSGYEFAVVHAFKQLDPRQPAQPHADQAELEAFIDRVQPGWRDVVIERHFLPRMLAAGTLPLVATGGLAGRVSYRSGDVPNVYFAGDWVGLRGYLIDASLDSARESARLILHSRSRVQASLAA